MKLKKGDKVIVITGASKGKEGLITKKLVDKVIVEGVNVRKVHLKPKSNGGTGEIIEREAPIHVSNVKLVSSKAEAKKTTKKAAPKAEKKETKKTTKPKKKEA